MVNFTGINFNLLVTIQTSMDSDKWSAIAYINGMEIVKTSDSYESEGAAIGSIVSFLTAKRD